MHLTSPIFLAIVPVISASALAGQECGLTQLTHSASPDVIGESTIACQDATISGENSFARSFDVTEPFLLRCVSFGIRSNEGGDWPVNVRVLRGEANGSYDDLELISSTTLAIPDGTSSEFFVADVPDLLVAPGEDLVLELHTPTRSPAEGGDGGFLHFGFNEGGQSSPTWFRAPECGMNDFIDLAAIGYPNFSLVLSAGTDDETMAWYDRAIHEDLIFIAPSTEPGRYRIALASTAVNYSPVDLDLSVVYSLAINGTPVLTIAGPNTGVGGGGSGGLACYSSPWCDPAPCPMVVSPLPGGGIVGPPTCEVFYSGGQFINCECLILRSIVIADGDFAMNPGDLVSATLLPASGSAAELNTGNDVVTFAFTGVPCTADIDGDGAVQFGDLLGVLNQWGACAVNCPADLDFDGGVGFSDLLTVLGNWGSCP